MIDWNFPNSPISWRITSKSIVMYQRVKTNLFAASYNYHTFTIKLSNIKIFILSFFFVWTLSQLSRDVSKLLLCQYYQMKIFERCLLFKIWARNEHMAEKTSMGRQSKKCETGFTLLFCFVMYSIICHEIFFTNTI